MSGSDTNKFLTKNGLQPTNNVICPVELNDDDEFDNLSEEDKKWYSRCVLGLIGAQKLKEFIDAVRSEKWGKLTKEDKENLDKALKLLAKSKKNLLKLLEEAFLKYTDIEGKPNKAFIEDVVEFKQLKEPEVALFAREKSALLLLLLMLIDLNHGRWLDMNQYSMLVNEKSKQMTKGIVKLMQEKAGKEWDSAFWGSLVSLGATYGMWRWLQKKGGRRPNYVNNLSAAQGIGQAVGQIPSAWFRHAASMIEADLHREQSEKELLRFLQEKLGGFKNELEKNTDTNRQHADRAIEGHRSSLQGVLSRLTV